MVATGGEAVPESTRVVDIHVHAIPPSLVAAVERGAFRGLSAESSEAGLRFRFEGMQPSPPAPSAMTDFSGLAGRGRELGIDVQLVAPWTDLFGYTLGRRVASSWSNAYNEALATASRDHPALVPMATIPLQFPDIAATCLVQARDLGCRGVMIGTDVPGLSLDAPAIEPVWEAAAGLGMPVLIHPTFLDVPSKMRRRGLKNAVGRIGELTVALTALLYSGALVRHSGLTVIAALGGAALVPARHRVLRNHRLGWSEADTDVEAALARLYFDTVVLDPAYLRYLVTEMGAGRFLLGSDRPFPWQPDPVGVVQEAALSPADAAAILGGTATRLFGLHRPLRAPARNGAGSREAGTGRADRGERTAGGPHWPSRIPPGPRQRGGSSVVDEPSVMEMDHQMQDVTSLEAWVDPRRTALLVVDMQNDFCSAEGAFAKRGLDVSLAQAIIPTINGLMSAARLARIPVIVIRNARGATTRWPALENLSRLAYGPDWIPVFVEGSWGAELVSDLDARPGDIFLEKNRYGAFTGTNLDIILRNLGTENLVVTGGATNVCVESTAREGFSLGYNVVLVQDACASISPAFHEATIATARLWFARVENAADVLGAWERLGKPSATAAATAR